MTGIVQRSDAVESASASGSRMGILLAASEVAASHTLDFDSLMDGLAQLVREIVDYEMYSVLVPTGDGHLQIAHSVGYPEQLLRDFKVPIGRGITGRAAATQATVLVNDVHREPAYLNVVDSVRSELAVPLVARGRVVAVLDLQSADPCAFDRRVSNLLELVATRFSLAIDVSQLYQAQARQHSILTTLRQIAQEFANILQLDELLRKVSTLVRKLIRYDVLAIYLRDPRKPVLRHYFGVKFEEQVRWRDIEIGQGLVGAAAAATEPILVDDTAQDPRYIASTPGIRSEVTVPLVLKNQMIGILDLQSVRTAGFSKDHLSTLNLLAPQVAAAIENARLFEEKARNEARLERDLIAARALQSHLLPGGNLRGSQIEIAARNEPVSVVSGDFYDFYRGDGTMSVLNGDVSGKGAAAALYAALASGLFRTSAASGAGPAKLFGQVNRSLYDRRIEGRFLAAHFMTWHVRQRKLVLAGSGLPYPFVCRQGEIEAVRLEGLPLGLFPSIEYDETALHLEPGDFAVTVSDGFSESLDENGDPYGEQRLYSALTRLRHSSANEILQGIFDDVRQFCDGCTQTDDRTAVVLRVIG